MPRIEINPERYQQFLDAFLHLGPRFSAVARRVNCSDETARRAWIKGWPGVDYAPPISRVYEQAEQRRRAEMGLPALPSRIQQADEARAASQQEINTLRVISAQSETFQDLAHTSAVDAVQGEVDILQSFRQAILGSLAAANTVVPALAKVASSVAASMELSALNSTGLRPDHLLRPLEKFARVIHLLSTSTKSVIEMQRLVLGAPQAIIEQRQAPAGGESGEATQRLGELAATIDIMRRHGMITFDGTEAKAAAPQYEGEESDAKPEPNAKDDDLPF